MEPDNPVLRKFVAALNAGDREAFFAVLTPTATMSDDGSERDLAEWTEREIFASNGHMGSNPNQSTAYRSSRTT
jgi:hypothetical protein